MKRAQVSKTRRIRHSCERCRQKKTKCPSEKPTCSFCRRLNQTCVYLPRRNPDASSSKEPDASKDPPSHRNSTSIPVSSTSPHNSNGSQLNTSTWQPENPEPPLEALEHFVDVYRENIYFQPLPLFNVDQLKDHLSSFPYYLRWSFLALALHYSSHSFYWGHESEAIEFYTTCSRNLAMELSADGATKVEVLQLLCLLALCEVIEGQNCRAWMTIGTASRLESLRIALMRRLSNQQSNTDAISRCHWSIMTLEKTFTPNSTSLGRKVLDQSLPQSPVPPPPLDKAMAGKSHVPGLSDAHESDSHYHGINGCAFHIIKIWGDIISYLGDVRAGLSDCPWLPSSRYAQLSLDFHEKEITLSRQHLLRHVSFPDRSPADLSRDREYWAPWLLTQIVSHAAKAALDNPFIHLVVHRGVRGVSQPRSFLQQTVDQALFNAQWVARLLQMCEDLEFSICDPLIGCAVAATATIPWLFQFAKDEDVAMKAKESLEKFEKILFRLSTHWPHIAHKLRILQNLQLAVGQGQQEASADNVTIRFQPELLWDLLDPSVSQITSKSPNSSQSAPKNNDSPSATLQVTTTFIHPIADGSPQVSYPSAFGAQDPTFQGFFEGFEAPFLEDFLSDSFLSGVL